MLIKIIIALALIDAVLYMILAKIKNRDKVEINYSDPSQFGVCPADDERFLAQQRAEHEKINNIETMPSPLRRKGIW